MISSSFVPKFWGRLNFFLIHQGCPWSFLSTCWWYVLASSILALGCGHSDAWLVAAEPAWIVLWCVLLCVTWPRSSELLLQAGWLLSEISKFPSWKGFWALFKMSMSHMSHLRSFMFLKRKLLLILCSGERMWSIDCMWQPSNDPFLQISENKGQKQRVQDLEQSHGLHLWKWSHLKIIKNKQGKIVIIVLWYDNVHPSKTKALAWIFKWLCCYCFHSTAAVKV